MAKTPRQSQRDELKEWLTGRPQHDAIAIAVLAACRVFPRSAKWLGSERALKLDLTSLPVLRRLLTSGVACKYPSPEVRRAATSAASADTAYVAAFASADAAAAAASAFASAAASADAAYVAAFAAADAADGVWEQTGYDQQNLTTGNDPFTARLWAGSIPEWFTAADTSIRAHWAKDPPGTWDFWLRWWDGVIAGKPLNWELQRDIVLELTDKDWKAGPERVAERIAGIEVRHAIARTLNAELILVNPQTGLVRSDPLSHLRADHLNDIVDTLRDAAKVFEGHGGPNGPYGAFEDECKIIEDASERYARRPIMLLRICRRVVERVKIKEGNGDCPKDDHLVADFVSSVASAAGDLMALDQDVREAETARAASNITPPSPEIAKAMVIAADKTAEISEGDLKQELSTDARLAISEPTTTVGQVALYQTKSRLLRVLEITKSNGKSAVEHVEKYPLVYGSIVAILLFLLG